MSAMVRRGRGNEQFMFVLCVQRRQPLPRDLPRRQIELQFSVAQADHACKARGDIDLVQRGDQGRAVLVRGLRETVDGLYRACRIQRRQRFVHQPQRGR